MSSGGKGRGRLFELLSQTSSGVDTRGTEDPHSDIAARSIVQSDSGISAESKLSGRQRFLQLLNDQYEASMSSSTMLSGGQGRAKLIEACTRSVSTHFRQMNLDENESEESSGSQCATTISIVSEESTEPEVVHRVGTSGKPITVCTNYIPLVCKAADQGIYEYDVKFEPNIHSNQIRHKCLNQNREILGRAKTFDGSILYLPKKLSQTVTNLKSTNDGDQGEVNIQVTYRRKKKMADSIGFYNILLHRIMKQLEYVQFGKKQFDPSEPKIIPQHRLMVWPGFVTAIDEFENGLMLLVDVSHRVLCETTIYDLLRRIHNSCSQNRGQNFNNTVLESLIGSVVLTRYNNKTYRIDDIDFELTPMSTFKTKDGEITYVQYYKTHYNIDIKDVSQPLLISRKERRVSGKEEKETLQFCLIPELCHLTGITDELRNDSKVLRDIATHTRVTPNQRTQAVQQFIRRVNGTPEAKQILADWGLELDANPLRLQARQLNEEQIEFGNKKVVSAGPNADFNRFATNSYALEAINITNWIVLCVKQYSSVASKYLDLMVRNSAPMGIEVVRPNLILLDDDKTETYVSTLRKVINKETQIVVAICPTSRDDRYAAIKKVCCSEIPIPSQVINVCTLKNDAKNRGIVQKIALQMNCKLGGSLWSIKIPFEDVMICGMDTYHEAANKSNSVSAFVASINKNFTRWYSKATIQNTREELLHGLTVSMQGALMAYQRNNLNILPNRIIVFRDGVGDGQLQLCKDYEIPQIKAACRLIHAEYNPQITFIVVQKRVNTRIFKVTGENSVDNPLPGCIVDHTITRRHLYDFFLVSQNVRMGTVTPTHFIVVQDEADFKPDVLQRLSYKLCFLYYNWPGTIRVPACCQYAHKMAYLVGQSIKRETAEQLADKLFYL